MRCRRPNSDLFPTPRLSTKVFPPAPLLPYPPSFQPYPSSFMRPPYSLPNRLSSPTPYPLSFTTSCFHEFKASHPTQVFHTSKTSPENPEECAAERGGLQKLAQHKTSAGTSWRQHLATQPTHCLSKRRRRGRRKKKGRHICTLKRENPSSLSEEEEP